MIHFFEFVVISTGIASLSSKFEKNTKLRRSLYGLCSVSSFICAGYYLMLIL